MYNGLDGSYNGGSAAEQTAWIFAGIFVIFTLAAIAAWRVSVEMERRRAAEYADLAGSLGFSFPANVYEVDALPNQMVGFWPFTQGCRHRIVKSMGGERDGVHWLVFDFRFLTGGGKHTHRHSGTAVIAYVRNPFPPLTLAPKTFMGQISRFLGLSRDALNIEPLRDRYAVNGADGAETHRIMNPRTIDFLRSTPTTRRWQMNGNLLVVAQEGVCTPIDIGVVIAEISTFIGCAQASGPLSFS